MPLAIELHDKRGGAVGEGGVSNYKVWWIWAYHIPHYHSWWVYSKMECFQSSSE